MTTDPAFRYPPGVFDAVVDAVPLLTRSKRDVVLFSSCYQDNQLKARGAVASVGQLINKKDTCTRLQQERERELQA
jgi:hypothetical protein